MTRRTFPPPQPQPPPSRWPFASEDPETRARFWFGVVVTGFALALLVFGVIGQSERRAAWRDCERVCAPYAPWVSGLSCYCDMQRRTTHDAD